MSATKETIIKNRKRIKLSELYEKIIANSLNEEERLLIARFLKTVNFRPNMYVVVYSQNLYIDLGLQTVHSLAKFARVNGTFDVNMNGRTTGSVMSPIEETADAAAQ